MANGDNFRIIHLEAIVTELQTQLEAVHTMMEICKQESDSRIANLETALERCAEQREMARAALRGGLQSNSRNA